MAISLRKEGGPTEKNRDTQLSGEEDTTKLYTYIGKGRKTINKPYSGIQNVTGIISFNLHDNTHFANKI